MELDEDLKDILNEFNYWKEMVSKANNSQKSQELTINSLKSKSKFYTDEINYLKNQNVKKDRQIEEYNKILTHFNEIEDKYAEIIKHKETTDAEIKRLKNEFLIEKNAWILEKQALIDKFSDYEQEKNNRSNIEKQVEELKKELEKNKNEHKSRLEYERQQHQNEIDYYKKIHEEQLGKLNEDLASSQIEVTNLKRCSAQIFKVPKVENKGQTSPTPFVTIQSVTSSSDIRFPKQLSFGNQRNKVKFPVDKKRKLFNSKEAIEID